MRQFIFTAILTSLFLSTWAQNKKHTDVRTPTWNIIGLRYDAELKPGKWASVFPPELKKLNNKVIELPGFMIPTKVGSKFTEFMFSMVPVASCPYCGTGDVPSMVQVKMASPIMVTDKPIKLKGIFIINDTDNNQSEFLLLNARQI